MEEKKHDDTLLEPIPWSPVPEEYTISWGSHKITVLRYEGKEYVNMSNAWKYFGKSKPTGDQKILEEAESGRVTRYQIGKQGIYILRDDLERLRKDLNDPVPLPPPVRQKKNKIREEKA